MAKWDLQRETAREQLKEQKRQYDAQFKRDLAKIALNAGLGLAGGVTKDWAGFELFGGKEKLDAYQRQIAEQEAAGADVRRQRGLEADIARGPGYVRGKFDRELKDLESQGEGLSREEGMVEVPRRGMARPTTGPGSTAALQRGIVQELPPKPKLPEPVIGTVAEAIEPKEYEEDTSTRITRKAEGIQATINALEGEYERAVAVYTPEGATRATRIKQAIVAKERERDEVLALAQAIHEKGVTYKGISRKVAKPKAPMKRRAFEDRSSAIWLDIVTLLPDVGEHRGSGDAIISGPYKDKGFTMNPEYWDTLDPGIKKKISAKLAELRGIEFAGNEYRDIDPEKMPEIKLLSKKQATSRRKEFAGQFTGKIRSNNEAYAGWRANWGTDPKARDKGISTSKQVKNKIKYGQSLTDMMRATVAYEDAGGSDDFSSVIENIAGGVSRTTPDGAKKSPHEIRVELAAAVAEEYGIEPDEADPIVGAYYAKRKAARNLTDVTYAQGKAETEEITVFTDRRRLTQLISEFDEKKLYEQELSDEATEREIAKADQSFEATLTRNVKLGAAMDTGALMEELRKIPDSIGPAAYDLLSQYYGGAFEAVLESDYPHLDISKMSEANKAGAGYGIYRRMNLDPQRYMDGFGISKSDLDATIADIESQGLATKTDIQDEAIQELIDSIRGSSPTKAAYLKWLLGNVPDIGVDNLGDFVE